MPISTITMRKACIILFLALFFFQHGVKSQNYSISDYIQFLPDSLFSESYSIAHFMKKNGLSLDLKNGYAWLDLSAHNFSYTEDLPPFEVAKFNSLHQGAFIIGTREIGGEGDCITHDSFFYQYQDGQWKDVKASIFPRLKLSDFIGDYEAGKIDNLSFNLGSGEEELSWQKVIDHGYHYYHLDIPRYGTALKVTIGTCDEAFTDEGDESSMLLYELVQQANQAPIILQWDKENAQFAIKK